MRLDQLVEQIVDALQENDNSYAAQDIYELLEFGPDNRNSHLNSPQEENSHAAFDSYRAVPLTGKEHVLGDYLMYEEIGHYPAMLLTEFATEPELRRSAISEGGLLNPFTTEMVLIVGGEVRPYQITFFDRATGMRRRFDKAMQVGFDNEYPAPELEWLE